MDKLFVGSKSDRSGRTAVIAEEIHSIWLYLSSLEQQHPQIACWIVNTPDAPPEPDFDVYRARSAPPPLPARRLIMPVPDLGGAKWSFLWAEEGNAVAALLDEYPIAFVIAGRPHGYARYVRSGASPWAMPWDEDVFLATFIT